MENIRPSKFEEFVGQKDVKEILQIAIESAKRRGESLDHVLLSGPPGLGKTTLGYIIANEMGSKIYVTSAPLVPKSCDVASMLARLGDGDVLFIDEIHRLPKTVEEVLYSAMEDRKIDIAVGEEQNTRSVTLKLKNFTLVGATTRSGLLSSPFRDRFGLSLRLNLYDIEELSEVIRRSADIMNISITDDGRREIASRSRGTPRVANRLLRRVRDYATMNGNGTIDKDIVIKALSSLGVDNRGLGEMDIKILQTIADFNGAVGLKTIAISVGEDVRTIEDVYEPYLIQIGFLKRTPNGREITELAREHLEMCK